MAGYQAVLVYGSSFYRQRFHTSIALTSLFILGGSIFFTVGSLVSGWLVNSIGRKKMTVFPCLLAGALIISYTNLPDLWLSVAARFLGGLFTGMTASALSSLILEQVPRFRGTLMSISSAFNNIGSALGAGLGGFTLLLYDYELMGATLGALMVSAAIIVYFLTVDPTSLASGKNI